MHYAVTVFYWWHTEGVDPGVEGVGAELHRNFVARSALIVSSRWCADSVVGGHQDGAQGGA